MKTTVWIISGLLAVALTANSATQRAASVALADVQAAYNAAAEGDTILIPAGSAVWGAKLNVTKGVSIIGAGTNATIISRAGMVFDVNPGVDKPIRISNMKLDINGYYGGGNYPIRVSTSVSDTNRPYHSIRIDHIWFNKGQYVITLNGINVWGVIDHCTFHNCDNGVQLNGGAFVWKYPIKPGTTNFMVIEDNLFLCDAKAADMNESIMSGQGVRFVVRYNTFDGMAYTTDNDYLPYEHHGKANATLNSPPTSDQLRGPPIYEIYGNTIRTYSSYRHLHIRGGSGLIFSNRFTSVRGETPIQLAHDGVSALGETTWAGQDQVANTFIWGNTWNGAPITDVDIFGQASLIIHKDRDYFMHPPDATSGKVTWTDWPGSRNAVFTPNVAQAYYPYTPLVYPHPIVTVQGGGIPGGGTNPVVSISPSSYDYGSVRVGTTNDTTFTVRNVGGGTLSGTASAVAPFSILGTATYTLGSNQSTTVTLRYIPNSAGRHDQFVTFTGGGNATVPVGGTGWTPLAGLSFDSSAGVVAAPFTVNADNTISQSVESEVDNGGRAAYPFDITQAGNYIVTANILAPSEAANSLFVNIDAEPIDPNMIWDIPASAIATNRVATWRGTGPPTPPANPQVWTLAAGTHQLIIRGREAGVRIGRITISVPAGARPKTPEEFKVTTGTP